MKTLHSQIHVLYLMCTLYTVECDRMPKATIPMMDSTGTEFPATEK